MREGKMHRRDLLVLAALGALRVRPQNVPGAQANQTEWEATSAPINAPRGLAFGPSGLLYITESQGGRLLRMNTETGRVRTVLEGLGGLAQPMEIAVSSQEKLWITQGNTISQVDAKTGNTRQSFGQGKRYAIGRASGIAISKQDEVYFSEVQPSGEAEHGIFRLDPVGGRATRVAGSDGPIRLVSALRFPEGLAFASSGLLYVADYENFRILQFNVRLRRATTVVSTDFGPTCLTVDQDNTLYFIDGGHVKALDLRNRRIRLVAGGGPQEFSGDGGPAIAAGLVAPSGLAVDSQRHLFISDWWDNRIRKVDAKTGIITTVAGNGNPKRPDIRTQRDELKIEARCEPDKLSCWGNIRRR
jgi:sugar lactone lactonase YvrE